MDTQLCACARNTSMSRTWGSRLSQRSPGRKGPAVANLSGLTCPPEHLRSPQAPPLPLPPPTVAPGPAHLAVGPPPAPAPCLAWPRTPAPSPQVWDSSPGPTPTSFLGQRASAILGSPSGPRLSPHPRSSCSPVRPAICAVSLLRLLQQKHCRPGRLINDCSLCLTVLGAEVQERGPG